MNSKDIFVKRKLAEKGKFVYTEEQFKKLKEIFIDNLLILKDKEKAFEDAYKVVFGGEKN